MSAEKELTLNEYQEKAMTTCMLSSENFSYMFLNLVGEVGEFASKVAKQIRKENMSIGTYAGNHLHLLVSMDTAQKMEDELAKEAGDILWQLSGLCSVMGWKLEDIAQMNLDKLAARQAIGTIDGNGDGIERGK
jgi:NTP pyrophosphatase (non-canonical NTP hydrolase)